MKIKALFWLVLLVVFSSGFTFAQDNAPVIDSIGAHSVDEGGHLEFVVTATDADGDSLSFTVENLPENASFDDSGNGHGLFEFDPDYTQAGSFQVRFIVQDSALADTELVDITVSDYNSAPELDALDAQTVDEGSHLEFIVGATDAEGDDIALTAEDLPTNASFYDSGNGNGLFEFDPDYSQGDVYNVRFVAGDGELADTQEVEITVNHINLAPEIDTISVQEVDENAHLEYLVTASDFDGDSLSFAVLDNPSNSSFTDYYDGTGLFVFDPTYTQAGSYNVIFIVSDGSLSDTMNMAITVNDVNAPPVIDPIDAQSVDEMQTLVIYVTSSDIDGQTITLAAEDLPTNATFSDSGTGNGWFSFEPDSTQSGDYTVRFIASDGTAADTELVDVTVNQVSIAPKLDPISLLAVNEGSTLEYVITASDFDGDDVILSMYDNPMNSAFVDSSNGHGLFTFNPDYTQEGSYTVKFVASDGELADTATMGISVNHYNTAPVFDPIDLQTVAEGATLEIHITTTDNENDERAISFRDYPDNSSLVDSGNGSALFTFTPDYEQEGSYNVSFIVNDGEYADTELVTIDVISTNRAPVIDEVGSRIIDETEHLEYVVSATDVDLQTITLTAENLPTNATFTDSGDGNGLFSFDPDYLQADTYTIRFIASDGELADTTFGDILVNNVNRLPVLDAIDDQTINEGDSLELYITSSDEDTDDGMTLTAEGMPSTNATFIDSGNGNGLFVFAPDYTQSGGYEITFIISDGFAADSATVTITVDEYNLPPELAAITTPQTVDEVQTLQFNISATDPDGITPTLAAYDLPTNAEFYDSSNGIGTLTFSPDYFQAGTYEVIFVASDGDLADSQVVEIVVNNVNRAPSLDPVSTQSVDEGQHLEFTVTASDLDLETLTLTAENVMSNAVFTDSGNGTGLFEFDPDYTQTGNYIVRFIASDTELADTIYVDITVNAMNGAPVLTDIPTPQVVGEENNLEILIEAIDPDGTIPTLTAFDLPTNASFFDSGDGTGGFAFNPVYGQAGSYDVLFIASDGEYADSQTVQIDVVISNSPPVLDSIEAQTIAEGATLQLVITATDPDSTYPLITALDLPENAAVYDSGNGHALLEFTPYFDQEGAYSIMIIASDGSFSDTGYADITVTNTNVAPIWDTIGDQTVDENESLILQVISSDFDEQDLTLTTSTLPTNATFVDSGNGHGLFSFEPDYTQSGSYSVTFQVTDGEAVDSELVQITVNNVNLSPSVTNIADTNVVEGEHLEFIVYGVDYDGGSLILTAFDLPTNAAFTDSGNNRGLFEFDPDYTQSGVYNVGFIASDGALVDTEIVEITVDHINLAPVLDEIGELVLYEGTLFEQVITSSDFDEDALTLTAENLPTNATFSDSGNGHALFSFDPEYGQSGDYSVTFIVDDGVLADTEIVAVTVMESNRPPEWEVIPDYAVQEGGVLAFNVSATDPDLTVPELSVSNIPANATFVDSANGNGRFRFSPDYSQAGIYDVLFLASDGVFTDTETVQITVNESGNQSPVIETISAQEINEGEHLEFVITATDPEGSIPILSAFDLPSNSSFVDSGNGNGLFQFDPDFFQAGNYDVAFIAFDGQLADTAIVEITVVDVGFAPELDSIGAQTVVEGETLELVITASDPDLVTPALYAEDLPDNATFVDSSNGTGVMVFTPDYDQAGIDTVLFIASDGALADSEYVQITITEFGNIAPTIVYMPDTTIYEGDSLSLLVTATDPDGDVPSLDAINLPDNSEFSDYLNGTGLFIFNPDFYQAGVYEVTFIADDGELADSQVVQITVAEINGPPVIDDIAAQTIVEGDSLGFAILAIDPDSDPITLSALDMPENAYLVDNYDGSGTFNFLPDYAQAGEYEITIIATDNVASDSQVVTITVTEAGNQAPQFNPIDTLQSVVEGDSLGIIISAIDPDGDVVTINFPFLLINSDIQSLTSDSTLFYFVPSYTQSGNYTISPFVSDGNLADTMRIHIEVLESGRHGPVFDPIDPQEVNEGDTLILTVTAEDPDGSNPPDITLNNPHEHSEFTSNGDGTATYQYMPDYYDAAIDTLVFIAIDSDNLQTTLRVELTTNETNIAPDLFYEGDSVAIQGETLTATLTATDSTDGDGGELFLSTLYLPDNAQFTDNGDYTGTFVFTPDYEQLGADSAIFIAADDGSPSMSSRIIVHLEIRSQNRAPVWDPLDSYEMAQAETLTVDLSATDPDGDTLILQLATNPPAPSNCSIVDNGDGTGQLTFAPDYTQAGVFIIAIEAYDLLDETIAHAFIYVEDLGNQPPTLNYIEDMSLVEGDTLEVQVTATDPDSTPPEITVEGIPYRFNYSDNGDGTMDIYFNPLYNQSGTYELLFKAIDPDSAIDSQYVSLEVVEFGNQNPRISEMSPWEMEENTTYSRTVEAADPDSTTPSLLLTNPPENATFEDNGDGSGSFSFSPTYFQAGVYELVFRAIDEEDSTIYVDRTFELTVINVNRSPVMDELSTYQVYENDSLGFLVTASDPDSTIPVLAQADYLENSTFIDSGNGVGYFSFEPDYDQSQSEPYSIDFIAYDYEDSLLYDNITVRITVRNVNRSPELDPLPSDTTIVDGTRFELEVSASDPDDVTPTLSADNLPDNATFEDNGDGTGDFIFITDIGDTNSYQVTFWAQDADYSDAFDSQTVNIHVALGTEHAPYFITEDSTISVRPEEELAFAMEAFDYDDGDSLVISAVGTLPAGAVLNDNGDGTAEFTWTPSLDQTDSVYSLQFMVQDQIDLSDTLYIDVDVRDWIRGDANGDGLLVGSDVIYLVNYLRGLNPRPDPTARGDANGDGYILGSDVTYLINYFRGIGPEPPASLHIPKERLFGRIQ